MKSIYILLIFLAIAIAFYEQSLPNSNVWIQVAGVVIFFFGLMKLMSKVSSNNKDNENEL